MTILNWGYNIGIDTRGSSHRHERVACEECPRWLVMTEVAYEKTVVAELLARGQGIGLFSHHGL